MTDAINHGQKTAKDSRCLAGCKLLSMGCKFGLSLVDVISWHSYFSDPLVIIGSSLDHIKKSKRPHKPSALDIKAQDQAELSAKRHDENCSTRTKFSSKKNWSKRKAGSKKPSQLKKPRATRKGSNKM